MLVVSRHGPDVPSNSEHAQPGTHHAPIASTWPGCVHSGSQWAWSTCLMANRRVVHVLQQNVALMWGCLHHLEHAGRRQF